MAWHAPPERPGAPTAENGQLEAHESEAMTTRLILALVLLGASSHAYAGPWSGPDEHWNEWHLGPVGVMGEVEKGRDHFIIKEVTRGTPGARAGLAVGDVILGVNGQRFDVTTFAVDDGGEGPLEALGNAIDEVEGTDGVLTLTLTRDGDRRKVDVHLDVIGSFSDTYPYDCRKSLRFLDQSCDFLEKVNHGGHETTTALIGLVLLSRGSSKYNSSIERIKKTLVRQAGRMEKAWNWNIGYAGIFLAEYYLKTEDPGVLRAIEQLVAITEPRVMGTGSFGYGLLDKNQRARPCNSAGTTVLWFWAMALKCGVEIDEVRLNLAIGYLAACTIGRGDGGIRYNYSAGGNDNASKTANTAIAFSLLGKTRMHRYAKSEKVVINPAYVMDAAVIDRARAAASSRDLTDDLARYLVKHLRRSRENHVTMSLGMIAVPTALAMHRDPNKFRAFMDYWKWLLRLSMGPNGEVYYHGNNQSHMGDRQLGLERMGAVTWGLIFAIGQQHLELHGGSPSIDGVIYFELSKPLKAAHDLIQAKRFEKAASALTRELRKSRSARREQAAAMMEYIVTLAREELVELEMILEDGDYVLADARLSTYKKNFKSIGLHDAFETSLEVELANPDNQERIKRGKKYYSILERYGDKPKKLHSELKRFIEADVDGFYSDSDALWELREQVLIEREEAEGS